MLEFAFSLSLDLSKLFQNSMNSTLFLFFETSSNSNLAIFLFALVIGLFVIEFNAVPVELLWKKSKKKNNKKIN